MAKKKDLTGECFGRLVVIKQAGKCSKENLWECFCSCGNTTYVTVGKLTSGKTRSCGCFRRDEMQKRSVTHHLSKTRLYRIWGLIKTRTTNPKVPNYRFYGGKGIKVCAEWRDDFLAFYNWAIENGYKDNLTIDRIDSDGDYCPQNCRWITQSENATLANIKRWAKAPAAGKE